MEINEFEQRWQEIGSRIQTLPKDMQHMILDDIYCAIQRRLETFEEILIHKKMVMKPQSVNCSIENTRVVEGKLKAKV